MSTALRAGFQGPLPGFEADQTAFVGNTHEVHGSDEAGAAEIKGVEDACDWVGIEDGAERSARSSQLAALGRPKIPRHIVAIPWHAWQTTLLEWKVDVTTQTKGQAEPELTKLAPTAVELGQAGSLMRVARMALGVDPVETAQVSVAVAAVASSLPFASVSSGAYTSSDRKDKRAGTLDQADDSEAKTRSAD